LHSDLTINWIGWRKLTIERPGSDADWTAIKHVRITLRGSGLSGSIGIASIEMIGNKWEVVEGTSSLKLEAVNNYDNNDYVTPMDTDIYDDIYEKVGGSDLNKEQSLQLKYTNLQDNTTAYAHSKYEQAVDLSKHNKVSFLLYGNGSGIDFIISFGAGSNRFQKKIKDDFIGWRKFKSVLKECYGV